MSRPYMPGVPAAGHVTSGGFWHPGSGTGCPKCEPRRPGCQRCQAARRPPALATVRQRTATEPWAFLCQACSTEAGVGAAVSLAN